MPHFSLLSQSNEINERMFCDSTKRFGRECIENSNVCRCVHRLKVKLGSIVELILYDVDDSLTHPFHLHGHKFYVMDMGTFKERKSAAQEVNEGIPKEVKNGNKNPPHKDSIAIPNPGYVRVKFRADNPGFWLGHCHFDWHLAIGMKLYSAFLQKSAFTDWSVVRSVFLHF
jgi:FtsP/CotA-like multicopper oxidase with cupredoxin domain